MIKTKEKNLPAQERSLTPVSQDELPAVKTFDPEGDIERAATAAKALMAVVAQTKPIELNGKKYLTFEHWQTIGQFFNHTVGTEWTKPIMENDKFVGYEAKSVLYADGKVVGGAEAACMVDERNWAGKPKFQLRSMAQTRAMAKALRSRFGFIPVLVGYEATPSEEMDGAINPTPVTLETKVRKPYAPAKDRREQEMKEEELSIKFQERINACTSIAALKAIYEEAKTARLGGQYQNIRSSIITRRDALTKPDTSEPTQAEIDAAINA